MTQQAVLAKVDELYDFAMRLVLQRLMKVDVTLFAGVNLVYELYDENEDLERNYAHGCKFLMF